MPIKKPPENQLVRCAIYTRKSTSAGLDMQVNSLETQRDVCQAYIRCQEHRNWVELPERYDDGGFTGGTLQRPALQRLIADIEIGRIDVVVIYKIDRLSRSLTDFVRLMDVMNKYQASFVSVTQTFDTSDSMGRLILNILLTFAQFERELMSERLKDRYAAKRKKGLYCGGTPPVGYIVKRGGKLVKDPDRADTIRDLFLSYPSSSASQLARDLTAKNFVSRRYVSQHGKERGGQRYYPHMVLTILRNPIYAGHFRYRGELHRAEVEPIITFEHWQYVQRLIAERSQSPRDPVANPLMNILHDEVGRQMKMLMTGRGRATPTRAYISESATWARGENIKRVMVHADRVESLAKSAIQGLLTNRIKLKESVLSLGLYSSEIAKLLRRGHQAARRVELMDPTQFRELLVALVPRAEVTQSELRLLVSCYELSRFLAWDGTGLFQKQSIVPKGSDRFRMVYAPAFLICGHPYFDIPLLGRSIKGTPNPELVALLTEAQEIRALTLTCRDKSLLEIARSIKRGPTTFARLYRLNYLAPDILAAIIDGSQPPDLTRNKLLYSSMPLDWEQQRHLLGFRPSP